MPTFTIYVTIADLTTLNAIFNGVAMICQQTVFIWGCALLASMWIILSTVAKAPIAAVGGNAQGVLPKGSLDAVLPFILAMLLTFPGFKGNIQVESTINGQVTVISNVPVVISIIPVTGSILSQEAGGYVQTAFQSTGTNYPAISATGNGFINPLKVLLASRSAVNRLNGVASQVDSVVSSCLGPGSGVDYSMINNLVSNAGNSGAGASTSIPIYGANPTALGALLYQAAQSTNSYVSNIGTGQTIDNCYTAAYAVADNIGTALQSAEFSRVVQGAVNGMDQPSIGGNATIDSMYTQWGATRNSATVNGAIAAGSQQAQNEVINLLMGELVNNELACLSAAGNGHVVCESSLVQANEIERNNIQLAAAEVPMLKYAGSFGNYLLALIIGLGPIMVMFMMFAGAGASKSIKTVAHLIAWPLLVTNVGAELINGMIYISVANFTSGIANAGVISQAETFAIYKELSFQVGSASHMMASLPVIMGMIFALGESAALVSVGTNIAPKGSAVEDAAAPTINKQEAIFSNSGLGVNKHTPEAYAKQLNGAVPMISASSQEGQDISRSSNTLQNAAATTKTLTQAATLSKDTSTSFSKQNYTGWDMTDSEKTAWINDQSLNHHEAAGYNTGDDTSSNSSNAATSNATIGLSAGAGAGGEKTGASAGANISGSTTAQASSSLDNKIHAGHTTSLSDAKDTSTKLQHMLDFAKTHNFGAKAIKDISNRIAANNTYTQSLSSNDTASDVTAHALEQTNAITAYSANIDDEKLIGGINRIPDLGMYMNVNGQKLIQDNGAVRKNLEVAKGDANLSATTDIGGDDKTRNSALLFRAAQITSQDSNATPEENLEARQFLAGALSTMMHGGVKPEAIAAYKPNPDIPTNLTGQNLPPGVAVPPKTQSATTPTRVPPHHAGGHHSSKQKTPPAPQPNHGSGSGTPAKLAAAEATFGANFNKPLETGFDPKGEAERMKAFAITKGLGAVQRGTMPRVGEVVVGEAEDLFHKNGSQTPTNYGEGGDVEAREKEDEKEKKLAYEKEAQSHVGKTRNNKGGWHN